MATPSFVYSERMQMYVPQLDADVANAMEVRDMELEDYLGTLRSRVDTLTDTTVPALPQGIMGLATGTATTYTNATTTQTDVTASAGASPTLTLSLSTSRQYKAVFVCRWSNASSSFGSARFVEGGVDRSAAIFITQTQTITVVHEWMFTPASASSTVYKVMAALVAAVGTLTAAASASTPMQFWIEDMGAV